LIKKQLSHALYLLLAQLLNQLRFPDINTMQNIAQIQRFSSLHERLNAVTEIAMQQLFSLLMNGRPISDSGIISNLSHSQVEILYPLVMLALSVCVSGGNKIPEKCSNSVGNA
jgi:hypothetical protein